MSDVSFPADPIDRSALAAAPSPAVRAAVVVPNWNGQDLLAGCIDSLLAQTVTTHVIVVDNGSADASLDVLARYPTVEVIVHSQNKGFAGGVNAGFRVAMELGFDYVAAFNSDAIADADWMQGLVAALDADATVGTATCKLLSGDGSRIDSTGDCYTTWGLPFPRGRHESDLDLYDADPEVFGASGGASLYRCAMLAEVGLFDEDFFAYFEDVDLSFRTQLAGWRIRYVPESFVYHQIGATSGKISGFVTRQTSRNTPTVLLKNVPRRYLWQIGSRYVFSQLFFIVWATRQHQLGSALEGYWNAIVLLPATLRKRAYIQRKRVVSDEYIWSILTHSYPPRGRVAAAITAVGRQLARLREDETPAEMRAR